MTAASLPALLLQHGPLLVLGVTAAARIGLPLPAAALMMATGALAASGHLSGPCLAMLVALSVLAQLLGDGIWFWAGRRHGHRVLRLLCRSKSGGECQQRGARTMRRWGAASLLAAKFVPGVSAVAPPMAGAMGMSLRSFVVAESASALVWTLVFMALGAVFGKEVEMVMLWLSRLDGATIGSALAALALAGALAWSWSRYRRVHPDAAGAMVQ